MRLPDADRGGLDSGQRSDRFAFVPCFPERDAFFLPDMGKSLP